VTADDDRGCYDPVLPRFTPFYPPFDPVLLSMLKKSMLNSMLPFSNLILSKSMLTFFDITYLYLEKVCKLIFQR